jgi:hypothetical protein
MSSDTPYIFDSIFAEAGDEAVQMCLDYQSQNLGLSKSLFCIKIIVICLMLPTLLIMYTNRQLLYHPKQILFAFLLFNTAQLYNVDVLEHRICKHEDWQVWLLRVTFYEFVKSEQDTELAVL